jgi:late competence protein required for DNA uptake (superfamily II DNA/RNA helicase)
MSEIKTCPHCGSVNINYVTWATHPACYCSDCNLLMTHLSDDQLAEIVDDSNCERVEITG